MKSLKSDNCCKPMMIAVFYSSVLSICATTWFFSCNGAYLSSGCRALVCHFASGSHLDATLIFLSLFLFGFSASIHFYTDAGYNPERVICCHLTSFFCPTATSFLFLAPFSFSYFHGLLLFCTNTGFSIKSKNEHLLSMYSILYPTALHFYASRHF